MNQTLNRAVHVFRQRVRRLAGRREVLGRGRQHRSPNRLKGVVSIEKTCKVGRDGHGKLMTGMGHGRSLIFRQCENAAQRFDVTDASTQLPSPIVPICRACLWEESFAESCSPRAATKPREVRYLLDGNYFWVFF